MSDSKVRERFEVEYADDGKFEVVMRRDGTTDEAMLARFKTRKAAERFLDKVRLVRSAALVDALHQVKFGFGCKGCKRVMANAIRALLVPPKGDAR